MIDSTFLPTTSASDISPTAKARAAGEGDNGENFGAVLAHAVEGGRPGTRPSDARSNEGPADEAVSSDAGSHGAHRQVAAEADPEHETSEVAAATGSPTAVAVGAEAIDPAAFAAALSDALTPRRGGNGQPVAVPATDAASASGAAQAAALLLADESSSSNDEPESTSTHLARPRAVTVLSAATQAPEAVETPVAAIPDRAQANATARAASGSLPSASAAAAHRADPAGPPIASTRGTVRTDAIVPSVTESATNADVASVSGGDGSDQVVTTSAGSTLHGHGLSALPRAAEPAEVAAPPAPSPTADAPVGDVAPATQSPPAGVATPLVADLATAPSPPPGGEAQALAPSSSRSDSTLLAGPERTTTAPGRAAAPTDGGDLPATATPVTNAPVAARAQAPDAPFAPAMVHRITQIVETLRNAPPPRSVSLEFPELDGLRLHVSLRGDTVHVIASGGQDALAAVDGMTRDLGAALQERGFDLGSFEDGREAAQRRAEAEAAARQAAGNGSTARGTSGTNRQAARDRRPEPAGLRL